MASSASATAQTSPPASDAPAPSPRPTLAPAWLPQERLGPTAAIWHRRHAELLVAPQRATATLVFIGDSIIDAWTTTGAATWKREYAPLAALDLGIGGDTTQNVLWRLENGELDNLAPRVAVVMIGTNNLDVDAPEDVAQGVAAILTAVRSRLPATRILLLGIFPREREPSAPLRQKVAATNALLAQLDNAQHLRYLDIGTAFLNHGQRIPAALMADYLHPTARGYALWARAMRPALSALLAERTGLR